MQLLIAILVILAALNTVVLVALLVRARRSPLESLRPFLERLSGAQERVTGQLTAMASSQHMQLESMRDNVSASIRALQSENALKLEEMRVTVDEKLQGTLERRLGESFRLVSERLETVHHRLGEVQTLADGVGDLKRVLSNVRVRGTWGEVQLGNLLEQVMSASQYEQNVATRPGSNERVEFAIRLPGRGDDERAFVWLPIDAKFPQEDYQRLLEAQEAGDTERADWASRQLETRIKHSARDICTKYIAPPHTTDLAIMFLPNEGLYAEVIRRAGLVDWVQRECRVAITGPTTLWAVLTSLQMGFRTLAVQQRSSEVWSVLGAVKTEFAKFGDVLDKVKKKLDEASDVMDKAGVRKRAIDRRLKDVEALPSAEQPTLLPLVELVNDEAKA